MPTGVSRTDDDDDEGIITLLSMKPYFHSASLHPSVAVIIGKLNARGWGGGGGGERRNPLMEHV